MCELWDNIKWPNVWIIGVLKEKNKKRKGPKKIFGKNNGLKFSKFDENCKLINPRISINPNHKKHGGKTKVTS